jgi:uncharacterized protein YeaO (DUF488 family)
MSVKTKQIYEKPSREDGIRFLISRYYPRGVKKNHFDEWLRALSPSPKLLFDYKEKRISWETFKDRFVTELANNIDSVELINILHDAMKRDVVTLLCYEKSGVPCHRHIVAELIEHPEKLPRAIEKDHKTHAISVGVEDFKTAKELLEKPLAAYV